MFSEIITGTLKLWWAWVPFIAVMITGAIWEARNERSDD